MAVQQLVFINNNPPQCGQTWLNSSGNEINNVISTAGIPLNDGDTAQLKVAVASYVSNGDFYTDSGVADAYVLTPITTGTGTNAAPYSLRNGMRARFRPANTNTGASTVNVASLGVISIKQEDGTTDPSAGDIPADVEIELSYDGAVFRIISSVHENAFNNIQYITSTQSWVVPSAITRVRFAVYAPGGGGGFIDAGTASTAGGQCKVTFSAVDYAVANGGEAGRNINTSSGSPQNGAAHGTATTGDYNITGGGSPGGAGGVNGNGDGMTAGQGGAGGLSIVDRNVTPGDSWTITIGAAGSGGVGVTASGADGAPGYVIIYY